MKGLIFPTRNRYPVLRLVDNKCDITQEFLDFRTVVPMVCKVVLLLKFVRLPVPCWKYQPLHHTILIDSLYYTGHSHC